MVGCNLNPNTQVFDGLHQHHLCFPQTCQQRCGQVWQLPWTFCQVSKCLHDLITYNLLQQCLSISLNFTDPSFLSKPSALKIIDNLTSGPNKVVLGWKSDMERVFSLPTLRLRRTLAAQEAPGFTFGVDNVGWVRN